MKKMFFLALLFLTINAFSQQSGTMYVAAKSGLTFREGPGTNFKAIDNIPYGTKVFILQSNEELKNHVSENIMGYWQRVNYNNKNGYLLDSYLLPWPPPVLATVKEMIQYLTQVTTPFGNKLTVKSGSSEFMEEMDWEIQKQLYKNGAEWHRHTAYEYGSDVFFLPGFTMQQGFLLIRLIPEFKNAINENDAFPVANKTIKRGEGEYKMIVDKEEYGDGYAWYKKISIEYEDGAFYNLELYMMDTQLVISFGSGV